MKRRRPTRRDLLIVIGRLQGLIGHAAACCNDRNDNRAADLAATFNYALNLCIDVRSYDPPTDVNRSPWDDNDIDKLREQI